MSSTPSGAADSSAARQQLLRRLEDRLEQVLRETDSLNERIEQELAKLAPQPVAARVVQ